MTEIRYRDGRYVAVRSSPLPFVIVLFTLAAFVAWKVFVR